MKFKLILTLALSAFALSCASTHPGFEGSAVSATQIPIKVSAQTIDNNPKDPFQLIEVTFENTSEEWLRINQSQVVINNPAKSRVSVVLGQDLVDWAQAIEIRKKKEEHNKKLLQTGLLVGGAILAGVYSDSPLGTTGAGVVVATSIWAISDDIIKNIRNAESVNKIPDTHLNRSTMIPGENFIRRWVLLNRPTNTYISRLFIQIKTVDGAKGTYEIKL